MRLRRALRLILAAVLLASVACAARRHLPWIKVDVNRKRLVDDRGHERLFHGVNVISKQAPYLPRTDSFSVEDSLAESDIADMRDMGFNVVRLLVALPGVMPERGVINATYLDEVAKIVDSLAAAGIYTILDAHQDLFSPRFCGNGFPDWFVGDDNTSDANAAKPFPEPSFNAFAVDENTGYPTRADCISKPFFRYYFSDAVGKAFQALYDNHDDLQVVFADYWTAIAKRFADSSAVLGYEILNEPFLGDIMGMPQLLTGGTADRLNLVPLYKRVHAAIRKVDDRHIILYQPTVGISQTVISGISSTGFTEGPGGAAYNDRQLLSYHAYCPVLTSDSKPASKALCDAYYISYMDQV
jgi:endoglycosylceramidase